uniref:Uncharacterized protein n=1 Tax=Auxenochlorella protothecoides TaxID=3075 RepID=A0A1D1ZT05_AUXPR
MFGGVEEVVASLQGAQQAGASQEQRAAATAIFEQLKSGDAAAGAAVATDLISAHRPLEVRVLGFTLLQHLVGARWAEFQESDQQQWAAVTFAQLQQAASGENWALRSKAALLLALVIRRMGAEVWDSALQRLLALAGEGPVYQGLVALVIKYVAEEITQASQDDIGGEAKRLLVNALTKTLPTTLGFLQSVLEGNYSALAGGGGGPAAEAAVHAALGATATMADWAPQGSLLSSGLLNACGFLLTREEFRDEALGILRHMAGRKVEQEDEAAVAAAARAVADVLSSCAQSLLFPSASLGWEGEDEEFAEGVCEACSVLAATHWARAWGLAPAIPAPAGAAGRAAAGDARRDAPAVAARDALLQAMLGLAGHAHPPLADAALPFWLSVLGEAASAAWAGGGEATAGGATPAAARYAHVLPRDAVQAAAGLAAEALSARGAAHTPQEGEGGVPPFCDGFLEYKEFAVAHRGRLVGVVRAAAGLLPETALAAAAERVAAATAAAGALPGGGAGAAGTAPHRTAARALEAAAVFSDAVLRAAADRDAAGATAAAGAADAVPRAARALLLASAPAAAALQSWLSLAVHDPALLGLQYRGLEGYGPVLGARPELAGPALARVCELLETALPASEDCRAGPPAAHDGAAAHALAPGWRDAATARQQVATLPLAWAKACPDALAPHLEALASRSRQLWDAGRLRAGERNALAEGVLLASAAGGPAAQASVLEWVLAPVRGAWAEHGFHAALASPAAFRATYMPVRPTAQAGLTPGPAAAAATHLVGGAAQRWALYHELHLVERAARRLAPAAGAPAPAAADQPFLAHARWALPCILRTLACIQAVWSPEGRAELAPVAAALEMAPAEKALYLRKGPAGRGGFGGARDPEAAEQSGDFASVGGAGVGALRGWLRHVREYGYQALGCLPTACPAALEIEEIGAMVGPALAVSIEDAETQHVRIMLRHVLSPLVRACPAPALPAWVLGPLARLGPHLAQRLAAAWAGGGPSAAARAWHAAAAEDDGDGAGASAPGAALGEEVVRDRLLRELTQEHAALLAAVAQRDVSEGGAAAGATAGATPNPTTHSRSLLEWVLERDEATAFALISTAVRGMGWPDDSAFRFSLLCRSLVPLARASPALARYVGGEVLPAALSSLSSEALALHQVEILGLIRDVLLAELPGGGGEAAWRVMASLPGGGGGLAAWRADFAALGSEKAQRDAIKKLLVASLGQGSLAALADWRPAPAGAGGRAGGGARAAARAATRDAARADTHLQGEAYRALFG